LLAPIDTIRFASGYGLLACFMYTYALLQERAGDLLRYHSDHDALSNCLNRRTFNETLEQLESGAPAGRGATLLLIDIDHFRRINENWGHPLGDQVLRYIASVLRAHAQGDVLAARFGGEEFAVIMPRSNVNLAEALAARVSRAVKSKRLSLKSTGDVIGEVTVSVGIARFEHFEEPSDLVARAVDCLAAAKSAGRDRIVTDLQLDRAA
jgi:diguanylate cyclase (GGDEF)-like protein